MIAAAFIGPGTVATATRAGTYGGYGYLLVVALAGVAGYVFMEMAARLTIVTERSLGSLLRERNRWAPIVLFAAVTFGCVAYQAGNLVGALGGLRLLFPTPRYWLLPLSGGIAALLWSGNPKRVARVMAYLVAGMGVLFVVAALRLLLGGVVEKTTTGIDAAIVLSLVGTTIVPYNFFLAAGLSSGSSLSDMRRGLGLSFVIGSVITGAILIVGTAAIAFTSFEELAAAISSTLGSYGRTVLGVGLFAAGFSSAATAPLAAAVAGRTLLGNGLSTTRYRLIWGGVLGIGLVVALFEVDIVPVILAAQVVNGLLLPLVALVVLLLANSRALLGNHVNKAWQNMAGTLVLGFLVFKAGEFFWGMWG